MRRKVSRIGLAGIMAALALAGLPAGAQTYPSRPIELVVPFPPGGPLDVSARLLSEKWGEQLGQPVVVVNRPGAGAALGARYVAAARPDGYTLLIASESPLITARLTQPAAGYDLDSFSYLFGYASSALLFAIRDDAPWKTLPEFVAAARARPEGLTYASYGAGTLGHFAAELFWQSAGVTLTHIPYRSSPEANTALYAGQVDMSIPSSTSGLGQGRGAQLIATTAGERLGFAPSLPTLRELGYDMALDYYALVAGPRGLPVAVRERLVEAHRAASERYRDEIAARLAALEMVPATTGGPAIDAVMRRQEARFLAVLPRLKLER
jgi:tripartite-type tricarboxylate transporter receptor subunit TctC